MNVLKLIAAASMVAAVAGCTGGGGGGGTGGGPTPIEQAWYNVYGDQCGQGQPRPGCNFYANGSKITANRDPAYYAHYLSFRTWYYTDSYGNARQFRGYAWLSDSTGILYDEAGFALNELEEGQSGMDLIGDFAAQQDATVKLVGRDLAAKHALSEATGIAIARGLHDWAVLGKKRERTDADLKVFTKRVFGISSDSAKAAIELAQKGDRSKMESLNAQVAAHWGTHPDTSKEILTNWYGQK